MEPVLCDCPHCLTEGVSITVDGKCPNCKQHIDISNGCSMESSDAVSFGDLRLDEDENVVAALVPDDVEQLYKHRNQVVAVTNKNFLFSRFVGHKKKLEDCYTIVSVSLDGVRGIYHKTHIAVGGLLVGIMSVLTGIFIAYSGITGELVGPGVVFIPLLMIPFGIALIFGLKRRVLVFELQNEKVKWVSNPLEFRKTQQVALDVCDFMRPATEENFAASEFSQLESPGEVLNPDLIMFYHYLIIILCPYAGVVWGIINLVRKKKRSGKLLLICSLVWCIVLQALFLLPIFLKD